jgi:SAM-dependent methyltransferase
MLSRRAPRGLVLDLGCGYAGLAEPLRDAGFQYEGLDLDRDALASVTERGFGAHHVDLRRADLDQALVDMAAGRTVVAVTAIDIVEHLHPHQPVLDRIAEAARRLGALVALSIPNVAHADLGLKLIAGRWDVTEIGLLDATHISLFDHRRFESSTAAAGLVEVDRFDMIHPRSEQSEPADHPYLRLDGVAASFLHRMRARADAFGPTYQFVRIFDPSGDTAAVDPAAHDESPRVDVGAPTFSVLVPPDAPETLMAQIAAQTTASFEIVRSSMFDAVAVARGRFLCVVDAGDSVPPTWLATFEALDRKHRDLVLFHPFERDGEVVVGFDLVQYAIDGGVPCCSLALPLQVARSLSWRLEPGLGRNAWPVFAAELAELVGVVELGASTNAGLEPVRGSAPASSDELLEYLGARPLLLGAGWHHRAAELSADRLHAFAVAEAATSHAGELSNEVALLRRELAHRDVLVDEAARAKEALERSTWWRITAPGRWVVAKFRSVRV